MSSWLQLLATGYGQGADPHSRPCMRARRPRHLIGRRRKPIWPTCTLTEKPSTCLVAACPPSLETVHTLLAYTVIAEHFLVTSLANRRRFRPHCVVPSIAPIAGENFPPSFAGSNLRKPGYFPSHGRHNCKFEAYWCRRRPPLLASFSLCPCPSQSTPKTAVTWNQSPSPLHGCPSSQKHPAIVDVKKRGQE